MSAPLNNAGSPPPPDNFLANASTSNVAATLAEAPITESEGTTIGRYKLLQQIGEGGFGHSEQTQQQNPFHPPRTNHRLYFLKSLGCSARHTEFGKMMTASFWIRKNTRYGNLSVKTRRNPR
jgi:hypothetical protein